MPSLLNQLTWLFICAIPVACITWTVTHENILKEFNRYCQVRHKKAKNLFARKFFYVFLCEYCFSHYITVLILLLTGFRMLFPDWRGYIISGFCVVWVANHLMSIYGWIRVNLRKERVETEWQEKALDDVS